MSTNSSLPPQQDGEQPPLPLGVTALSASLRERLGPLLPETILPHLLKTRTTATNPKDPRIIAASPTGIVVEFEHPVREYWLNPPTLRLTLTLPSLPPPPTSTVIEGTHDSSPAEIIYARLLAQRLVKIVEGEEEEEAGLKVRRFAPPQGTYEWWSVMGFLFWTLAIAGKILGVWNVFSQERWFNVAVCAHAVVLVKRSKEVRRMSELREKYWEGGWFEGFLWAVMGWVEGSRAVGRFLKEVEEGRKRNAEKAPKKDGGKEEKEKKGEPDKYMEQKGVRKEEESEMAKEADRKAREKVDRSEEDGGEGTTVGEVGEGEADG